MICFLQYVINMRHQIVVSINISSISPFENCFYQNVFLRYLDPYWTKLNYRNKAVVSLTTFTTKNISCCQKQLVLLEALHFNIPISTFSEKYTFILPSIFIVHKVLSLWLICFFLLHDKMPDYRKIRAN